MDDEDFFEEIRAEECQSKLSEVRALIADALAGKIVDAKAKNILFQKMKYIIDHDLWYSTEDRNFIATQGRNIKFFSKRQKDLLQYSSIRPCRDQEQ